MEIAKTAKGCDILPVQQIEHPVNTGNPIADFLAVIPLPSYDNPIQAHQLYSIKGTDCYVQTYKGKDGLGVKLYTPECFEGMANNNYRETIISPKGKVRNGQIIRLKAEVL